MLEKLYNVTQEQRRLEQQRDMLAMVGVQDTDLNSRLSEARQRARELASDIDTTSRL
ncbi:hypothetical protein PVA45_08670 (plasmid) [Entomospira entomophila]|uniref:Uncharacterized protein n=1 Tax=Entomospira entomophila TaxID=2719988 RepID=A0A968KX78_9SPIO|nr:hypothetical protein [Entomospira entomophilus]NIZ41580.1 hypothetical protein [Entomospira entomophilus]WDI36481.1 hypothetical protein PVA45_08670 [Entomospira entomophilus]